MRPLLCCLLWCSTLLAAGAAEKPGVDLPPPAEVSAWNRPIVQLRAPLQGLSPAERAARITQRLAALDLAANTDPARIQVTTLEGQQALLILVGDRLIMSLLEGDRDPESGQSLADLGAQALAAIDGVLAAKREQAQPRRWLMGGLQVLGATVALLVAVAALLRCYRSALDRVLRLATPRLPRVGGIDASSVATWLLTHAVKLPLLALGALATFIWLELLLHAFPYTRPWAAALGSGSLALFGSLLAGFVSALPGLAMVAVILILTRMLSKAQAVFFDAIANGTMHVAWMEPETARASRRVISILLWLFAITVAYPYLPGSSSDAFKGVSVFAGLLLTLGSAGLVGQVVSGLMVVYARTMRTGDLVKIGDVVGEVVEIGFLSTKLRSRLREEVTIPNASLVGATVINWSRLESGYAQIQATVTIGYDTPWRQVQAMLIAAAGRVPRILAEPAPFVVQRALSDFYVEYDLRCAIADTKARFGVLSELHGEIQDEFNAHGVQIMSPHFEHQPAQPVLVPKANWHLAPAVPPAG
jgi:small-conductance mechanosensitive channel